MRAGDRDAVVDAPRQYEPAQILVFGVLRLDIDTRHWGQRRRSCRGSRRHLRIHSLLDSLTIDQPAKAAWKFVPLAGGLSRATVRRHDSCNGESSSALVSPF